MAVHRRTQPAVSAHCHLCSAATRVQLHLLSMKVPGAALAVLLCTMSLCSQIFSVPFAADTPSACCFSYIARQFPRKFIADYYETSSQCSKPGVIFQTKRQRQICADPREAWVQEYITHLELNA